MILAAVVLLSITAVSAAEGDSLWSHTYDLTGEGRHTINSIWETNDECILLGGEIEHLYTENSMKAMLLKVTNIGDTIWTKLYDFCNFNSINSVIETTDGYYLCAGCVTFPSSALVIKNDSNGSLLWSNLYDGGGEDVATSILETTDGSYMISGWTSSIGAGHRDMWLLKINPQGDSLWSNTVGTIYDELAFASIKTNDGGYLLAGRVDSCESTMPESDVLVVKTDSLGNSVWTYTHWLEYSLDQANAAIEVSDGYVIIGNLEYSAFVTKLGFDGQLCWFQRYGSFGFRKANAIIEASDGGYLVAGMSGSYPGPGQVYVLKIDTTGDSLWSRTFGDVYFNEANAVIQASNGNYLVAGYKSIDLDYTVGWLICLEGPDTPVEPENKITPFQFSVSGAFPNPFNPTTTIRFDLPVASHVRLDVFDINGRCVGGVGFGESDLLPGTHAITFDGSHLSSGIYIYRLHAGEYNTNGKMVLMK